MSATTLAEAIRKAAVVMLDVEFDEIQAGYRYRSNDTDGWIDVYLYDSLSSGAGYCAQVGMMTEELLVRTEELLKGCDCDTACNNCLKHFRNQRIQGDLDRFAALELLEFGRTGQLPELISSEIGCKMIAPLKRLLDGDGISLYNSSSDIIASNGKVEKKCLVYPAMMKRKDEWDQQHYIAMTKEALKRAKPYAVKQIIDAMT